MKYFLNPLIESLLQVKAPVTDVNRRKCANVAAKNAIRPLSRWRRWSNCLTRLRGHPFAVSCAKVSREEQVLSLIVSQNLSIEI
jgi:hypothetical protein